VEPKSFLSAPAPTPTPRSCKSELRQFVISAPAPGGHLISAPRLHNTGKKKKSVPFNFSDVEVVLVLLEEAERLLMAAHHLGSAVQVIRHLANKSLSF
jgi:hypothetical protein